MKKHVMFAVISLLQGCGDGERIKTTSAIVGNGWSMHPAEEYHPEPLYCYKTLGHVDCHSTPLLGSESRIQGYYAPPKPKPPKDTSFFSFPFLSLFKDKKPDQSSSVSGASEVKGGQPVITSTPLPPQVLPQSTSRIQHQAPIMLKK